MLSCSELINAIGRPLNGVLLSERVEFTQPFLLLFLHNAERQVALLGHLAVDVALQLGTCEGGDLESELLFDQVQG